MPKSGEVAEVVISLLEAELNLLATLSQEWGYDTDTFAKVCLLERLEDIKAISLHVKDLKEDEESI